ncbi:MAG: cobaltochelatase subunit CobN, partial [Pseudomonadota bacterium]
MHLLLPGEAPVGDGEEAFDLQQTPGDVLVLSFADTELALLNTIVAVSPCDGPSVRLTDMKFLRHPMSVDLYTEQTAAQARFIIVRALGGAGYWSYGLERLGAVARGAGIPLAVLPGDTKPDPALLDYGTVDADVAERLHGYFNAGGAANLTAALAFAFSRIGLAEAPAPASPLPAFGLYWPDAAATLNEVLTAQQACPRRAGLVFYRALLQSGDTAPVDAAIAALNTAGVAAIPLFVSSLKSPADGAFVAETFTNATPDVVVNMTAFAVSNAGGVHGGTALDSAGVPVIQAVLAAQPRETWVGSQRGLAPRDLAMHVVLPEVDGRIHGPAIAFKAPGVRDARTQYAPVRLTPEPERVERLAQLARRWADLGATSPQERRVGLVFANYPNRDGRLANGVGLDTPASAARMIEALRASGFATEGAPEDARALMDVLLVGPTNAKRGAGGETLTVDAYESQFATLPQALREAVIARWGAAQTDPFVVDARFQLPVTRFGNLALLVQPARGYNIDPKETYHSPDLVPPHGYLAAYFWLREAFGAHAVVHLGKHGTLEWLPGKATALSESCYPDAVLGALPNIYPFIVNDPGEGAQAKRRTGAVIIDHMTPPLARAESHGAGAALEHLLDEFAQAEAMDPARAQRLKTEIARAVQQDGFDRDIGIAVEKGEIDPADLIALDSHLCDLKELQIRDGLHVLGQSPEGPARTAHLVALARGPRGEAPGEASLLRALADDLGLYGFDPLDCVFGEPWMGAKPDALTGDTPWRTNGDTVERLEALASRIMAGEVTPDDWAATGAVLGEVANRLVPALDACGASETRQTLAALNGRFVPPGPAGAPTRGRPDVLPTGRNFYAVDVRAVPSRTAWELGKASAERLMARHFQDHGEWLTAIALSAWGTSNMRTGGDDIAQALALIGAAPVWEATSGRVTGFQVTPLSDLGRPRVDVTLRISGFFRDAFP